MRFLTFTLLAAALAVPSFADDGWYRGRDRDRDDYRYNDGYYNGRGGWGGGAYGGGYGRSYGASAVSRTIRDLQDMQRYAYVDGHERGHFNNALSRLYDFQNKLQREGRWDNGKLDHAISDMEHLANARQLDPRMRDMVARDLYALRDFRASRGNNGGYYGYGDRRGGYYPY